MFPLCRPHTCHHCGEKDSLATHGLSCHWSKGCHHRHAAVIDITHRTLVAAKIPSCLEPSGLHQMDKHPDSSTVVPLKKGKLLVWHATCPDTIASSYFSSATREVGAVAALAEENGQVRLSQVHTCFHPSDIWSLWATDHGGSAVGSSIWR